MAISNQGINTALANILNAGRGHAVTAPKLPSQQQDTATANGVLANVAQKIKANRVQDQAATQGNVSLAQRDQPSSLTYSKKMAPAATQNGIRAGQGEVVVDIKNSESLYENRIYWSTDNFKTRNYLGTDNETGSYNLGSFAPGTQIQFGIDNGSGNFFTAGKASLNEDNVRHARISKVDGGVEIGFEDLFGGGDQDFNDAIISVRSVPVTEAATSQTGAGTVQAQDNRSGLGDGTNPGQGAGRLNASNQGTDNPYQAKGRGATAKIDVMA